MRVLIFITLLAVITACSHPLEIVGEGDIMSASGDRTCLLEELQGEQENCTKNYVTDRYQETYFAEPRGGWDFDHWENYCTKNAGNECSFNISAANVRSFWGKTVPPLRAVFIIEVGAPITDFVTVHNLDWAQVGLFTGLPWWDIHAACWAPGRFCEGVLGGYDMQGWSMAKVDDVNGLFNHFVSPFTMGPGPWVFHQRDTSWAPAIFAAGLRPITESPELKALSGVTRSSAPSPQTVHLASVGDGLLPGDWDVARTDQAVSHDSVPEHGAWFFRIRQSGSVEISDTVIVGGTEWAQPDLFHDATWDELFTLCPGGICGEDAIYNGYALDGWIWASADDLNTLLNAFIPGAPMGPGPDNWAEAAAEWAPAFFAAGFRTTIPGYNKDVWGLIRTETDGYGHQCRITDYTNDGVDDVARTDYRRDKDDSFFSVGAFLFRVLD